MFKKFIISIQEIKEVRRRFCVQISYDILPCRKNNEDYTGLAGVFCRLNYRLGK